MGIETVQRESLFIGRGEELENLRASLIEAGGVLFLHGLAGSGKSSLVRRFADEYSVPGTRILILDCGEIEPTEEGFLNALTDEAGRTREENPHPLAPIESLGSLSDNVVVCLDQYEVLRLLDTWLRQEVVPLMPRNVSLLLVGREQPNPAWRRLPAGSFQTMKLKPLGKEDSEALVRSLGVAGEDVDSVTSFAVGHPLTLVLGALAIREHSAPMAQDATMSQLLDVFTSAYLKDLDGDAQQVLRAAALVRRVNKPLLEAMLPDVDPWEGFEKLAVLPFVHATADGLTLHEVLQQSLASQMRAADPTVHLELRRRAWTYLREQLRSAPRSTLWRHTADMIYLLENRAVREAHFPRGAHEFAVEKATSSDESAINDLIQRHETAGAAELLESWWTRCPEAFRVARDWRGDVAGFSIIINSGAIDLRRFSYDPVVNMWLGHLRDAPISPGQEMLLIRRWLTWEAGDGPCEAQASMWLDLKRTYMQLRPRLRRNYGVTDHPEVYGPVMDQLQGGVIPGGVVDIDGRRYSGLYLEFGPASVDGWLTRLAAIELGLPEDELLDVRNRQLLIDGRRVDLTHKEFEVMHFLRERGGDAVARAEILQAIWGYEEQFGSNVVDAVIHTLRKKLANHADMIETVRGVGYRLTAV